MRPLVRATIATLLSLALTWALLAGVALLLRRDPTRAVSTASVKATQRRAAPPRPRLKAALSPPRAEPTRTAASQPDRRPVEPPPEPPRAERPKPVERLDGQIVETARPETEERPDKARYLGRYDSKVAKETKSTGRQRKERDLGTVAIDKPSELQSPQSKRKEPSQVARAAVARPATPQAQRSQPSRSEVAAAKPPNESAGRVPDAATPSETRPGPGAASEAPPRSDMMRPSVVRPPISSLLLPATSGSNVAHNLQALSGSPGSDDYLPDVEDEGATNLLNTRKFRYWEFFEKVRERVRGEWNPAAVWQSRDPTGKKYGVRDRLTVVRVRLDPDGNVKELRVQKPSGLSFLDDEASRAFSAGGPYPNPPAGLLNERGEIEFQFGFMFEISASRFRFYRMGSSGAP